MKSSVLNSHDGVQVAEKIEDAVKRAKTTFLQQKTKPLAFRLEQLRKLWCGQTNHTIDPVTQGAENCIYRLQDYQDALITACHEDLGKSPFETLAGEIRWCQMDIVFVRENLAKWMEDEKVPGTEAISNFQPRITKEPIGTVLIIGPYNFPIQLSITPLIGAIASGCTAVVKPSEDTPNTSRLLHEIITEYLDQSCYICINGGIPETTALLAEKWDKIFFTGSQRVGKIIAAKAAMSLTPVTLELGGLNPAIVTKSADPGLAARRLVFGKLLNAGQVCLSHNYTLLHRELFPEFMESLKNALKEMYPGGAKSSGDFGRIVNKRNIARIKNMVSQSNGTILVGGDIDEERLFVEPTVMLVNSPDDSLLAEESFGPLMPILLVDSTEEAISVANALDSSPLSLSVFGLSDDVDKVLNRVRSGGASVNDTYVHAGVPAMPLGGVGQSGMGSYRGRASFDCFTHQRSMTTTPSTGPSAFAAMYPPYDEKLAKLLTVDHGAWLAIHHNTDA